MTHALQTALLAMNAARNFVDSPSMRLLDREMREAGRTLSQSLGEAIREVVEALDEEG